MKTARIIGRWLGRLAGLALVLVALRLASPLALTILLNRQLPRWLHVSCAAGWVDVGWWSGRVAINDFVIRQPPGFHGGVMFAAESVSARVDWKSLRHGPITLSGVRIVNPEFNILHNDQEVINFDILFPRQPRPPNQPPGPPASYAVRVRDAEIVNWSFSYQGVSPAIRPRAIHLEGINARLQDVWITDPAMPVTNRGRVALSAMWLQPGQPAAPITIDTAIGPIQEDGPFLEGAVLARALDMATVEQIAGIDLPAYVHRGPLTVSGRVRLEPWHRVSGQVALLTAAAAPLASVGFCDVDWEAGRIAFTNAAFHRVDIGPADLDLAADSGAVSFNPDFFTTNDQWVIHQAQLTRGMVDLRRQAMGATGATLRLEQVSLSATNIPLAATVPGALLPGASLRLAATLPRPDGSTGALSIALSAAPGPGNGWPATVEAGFTRVRPQTLAAWAPAGLRGHLESTAWDGSVVLQWAPDLVQGSLSISRSSGPTLLAITNGRVDLARHEILVEGLAVVRPVRQRLAGRVAVERIAARYVPGTPRTPAVVSYIRMEGGEVCGQWKPAGGSTGRQDLVAQHITACVSNIVLDPDGEFAEQEPANLALRLTLPQAAGGEAQVAAQAEFLVQRRAIPDFSFSLAFTNLQPEAWARITPPLLARLAGTAPLMGRLQLAKNGARYEGLATVHDLDGRDILVLDRCLWHQHRGLVELLNLAVAQPADRGPGTLLRVNAGLLSYDPESIDAPPFHVREAAVDGAEIYLIRDTTGVFNVNALLDDPGAMTDTNPAAGAGPPAAQAVLDLIRMTNSLLSLLDTSLADTNTVQILVNGIAGQVTNLVIMSGQWSAASNQVAWTGGGGLSGRLLQPPPLSNGYCGVAAVFAPFSAAPPTFNAQACVTDLELATIAALVPSWAPQILGGYALDLNVTTTYSPAWVTYNVGLTTSQGNQFSLPASGPPGHLVVDQTATLYNILARSGGLVGHWGRNLQGATVGVGSTALSGVKTIYNGAESTVRNVAGGLWTTTKGVLTANVGEIEQGLRRSTVDAANDFTDSLLQASRGLVSGTVGAGTTLIGGNAELFWRQGAPGRWQQAWRAVPAQLESMPFPPPGPPAP